MASSSFILMNPLHWSSRALQTQRALLEKKRKKKSVAAKKAGSSFAKWEHPETLYLSSPLSTLTKNICTFRSINHFIGYWLNILIIFTWFCFTGAGIQTILIYTFKCKTTFNLNLIWFSSKIYLLIYLCETCAFSSDLTSVSDLST